MQDNLQTWVEFNLTLIQNLIVSLAFVYVTYIWFWYDCFLGCLQQVGNHSSRRTRLNIISHLDDYFDLNKSWHFIFSKVEDLNCTVNVAEHWTQSRAPTQQLHTGLCIYKTHQSNVWEHFSLLLYVNMDAYSTAKAKHLAHTAVIQQSWWMETSSWTAVTQHLTQVGISPQFLRQAPEGYAHFSVPGGSTGCSVLPPSPARQSILFTKLSWPDSNTQSAF